MPDAHADPDSDLPAGSALPDPHADADPHTDADADADAHSDADPDANSDADADYSVAAVMRPRRFLPAAADRPAGDRPASDRPARDRPACDRPAGDPTLPVLSVLSVLPRAAAGLALRSPRISGLPDLSSLLPLAASSGHLSERRLPLPTHAVLGC
jgi:hypothetical protein